MIGPEEGKDSVGGDAVEVEEELFQRLNAFR
jgi:hypothetical protein